jgi:hypothetical protein
LLPARIAVQTMQTVDRDRLLRATVAAVSCDGCEALYSELEHLVGELGLPLVPLMAEGSVILRPPGS